MILKFQTVPLLKSIGIFVIFFAGAIQAAIIISNSNYLMEVYTYYMDIIKVGLLVGILVSGGLLAFRILTRSPLFYSGSLHGKTQDGYFDNIIEFGVEAEQIRTSHGHYDKVLLKYDKEQDYFARECADFDTESHLAFAWAQSDLENEAISRGEILPEEKRIFVDSGYVRNEKLIRQFKA